MPGVCQAQPARGFVHCDRLEQLGAVLERRHAHGHGRQYPWHDRGGRAEWLGDGRLLPGDDCAETPRARSEIRRVSTGRSAACLDRCGLEAGRQRSKGANTMGADIARISYDPGRKYYSVVTQQGRVTLEADVNEQNTLAGEALRKENLDIIGPAGTPDNGYEVTIGSGGGPIVGAGTM